MVRLWIDRRNFFLYHTKKCCQTGHVFGTLGKPKLNQFPISNESLLQMITNQSQGSIILGLLLYFIRSFLQVGFRFQYQLMINLVWLSIDFSSFSWSQYRPQGNFKKLKISFRLLFIARRRAGVKVKMKPFLWLYILVCAVAEKHHEIFSFKKVFFSAHFAINLFYFHKT